MRQSRRPGQRRLALVAWTLGLALLTAACLPASVRPTPTPTPTAAPTPTPLPTPVPTPPPPTPTPAPTFEAYTVRRGDSLVSIARRFATDGRSVAYWNRQQYPSLDPESADYRPNNLQIGWVLQILRGGAYVPPEDDGESGELYTPAPEEEETFEEDLEAGSDGPGSGPPEPDGSPSP